MGNKQWAIVLLKIFLAYLYRFTEVKSECVILRFSQNVRHTSESQKVRFYRLKTFTPQ